MKRFRYIVFTAIFLFLGLTAASATELPNPLKWDTIEELINAIINFPLVVALALAPIMAIIAGFYFITAGGDPQKVATARKIILYAAIGLGIILFSKAVISIVKLVLGIR